MVRVPLTVMVAIYLSAFLLIIAAAWARGVWQRRRQVRRALQFRLRCAICGFEFEDHSAAPLPGCPRCGRLNERLKIDPL